MRVILILLAVLLAHVLTRWSRWRLDEAWFDGYLRRFRPLIGKTPLWSPWLRCLTLVFVLGMLLRTVRAVFGMVLPIWGTVLIDLAVLLYAMRGGIPFIQRATVALRRGKRDEEASSFSLLPIYHCLFAVMTWFVLLGSVGVVLYYFFLVAESKTRDETQEHFELHGVARTVLAYLDWLPLRLMGTMLALVGNFPGSTYWRFVLSPTLQSQERLKDVNMLSEALKLSAEEGLEQVVHRAFLAWLVILPIVSMIAWIL